MAASIDNLKYFLKEMFQFNENDLDFGIYKIYNLKRKHIESFIDGDGENDLTPIIEKVLKDVNLENQKTDAIELSNFLKGINKDSLLEDPEKNYEKIKGQLELDIEDETQKAKLVETLNNLSKSEGLTEELKDKIYNHILGFFQMYYSNGDFGYNDRSRDLYKVPYEADYNGSDTMFHWKHKGSLYIKTGTSFNAIKFTLNGKKIEYRLETNENSEDEGTSQNNNKDSQLKHYRFDRIEKVKDKTTKEEIYQVIFNLSDASTSKVAIYKSIYKEVFKQTEVDKYLQYEKDGKTKTVFIDLTKDFDKVQNGQIKGLSALRQKKLKIEKEVKNNFDRGVRLYDESAKEFTDETLKALYTLDQKLNSFYIGNDADYFIHENLNEFLTNEKQRFVKNYIFDDLESIYNGKLDNTTLLIAKAFDNVSSHIIEFLSAIEDFQKYLFTKKKKVVESEYCITIDYIEEKYYQEILDNKNQLQDWENLFSLKIKSIEDIKSNPTLVLDTKYFKQPNGTNPFKDKILGEIDDLDTKTNGVLINSENYQALELLQTKFKEKVKTIYIDPPYNTGGDGFAYKDNFRHSSWCSLMFNRLQLGYNFLVPEGLLFTNLDDNEGFNIKSICDSVFKPENFKANFIWQSRKSKQNDIDVSLAHNYTICYAKNKTKHNIIGDFLNEDDFANPDNHKKGKWKSTPVTAPGLRDRTSYFKVKNPNNNIEYSCPEGRHWTFFEEDVQSLIEKGYLYFGTEGNSAPNGRRFWEEVKDDKSSVTTIWNFLETTTNGSKRLKNLLGHKRFSNPKPVGLVKYIGEKSLINNELILDFFAGSGTTGESIISMNKNGIGKNNKYMLVEMGLYFDTLTKPRIQKVIYSDNWKNGKPLDNNGSLKHIFKYQVLEQYEDVLDNLQVYNGALPESLPIKYLYKPEENSLDSNLNLFSPFVNCFKCGQPSEDRFLDLVETYNYLQGYFIKSIKTYELNKKYYKIVETTNGVLVIWRGIAINENDSKQVIEIASKYKDIQTIEINAEFATLNLDKNNYLKVGEAEIELKIISKEVFNQ